MTSERVEVVNPAVVPPQHEQREGEGGEGGTRSKTLHCCCRDSLRGVIPSCRTLGSCVASRASSQRDGRLGRKVTLDQLPLGSLLPHCPPPFLAPQRDLLTDSEADGQRVCVHIDAHQTISQLVYCGRELVETPNLRCLVGLPQNMANSLCARYDDRGLTNFIRSAPGWEGRG